ncbi:MAG: glycosyltransferase family 9 protein [Acidobacteria bacterium]|nr:glycosyltransferase family 9 protein [Acidobacteriota bacterium]
MRILIVRTGAMGDIIHGMHAVAGLRACMPKAELGWVIEPHWGPLLRSSDGDMPLVHRIHRAETKAWNRAPFSLSTLRSVLSLRDQLKAGSYDLCIDLQGSVRSAVIGRMAGAKQFAGSASPAENIARLLYKTRVHVRQPHVIAQAAEILSGACATNISPYERVPFPYDQRDETWCDDLLGNDTRPVAMIAPRAGWGAKQWPAERYGAVSLQLAEMGFRILVNALPGGDMTAAEVVTASEDTAQAMECTLPQLIALTRRLKLFIGGDTGPMHLASAMGVPCVALFGPTDPKRTGPWGTNARVLRNAKSVTDHRRYKNPEPGLMRISTEDVMRAARELTEGSGRS